MAEAKSAFRAAIEEAEREVGAAGKAAPAAESEPSAFRRAITAAQPQYSASNTQFGDEPPGAALAGNWGIPGGGPANPAPPPGQFGTAPLSEIGTAAAEGYHAVPADALLGPEATRRIAQIPLVGPSISEWVNPAASVVLGGLNAGMKGAQKFVQLAADNLVPGSGTTAAGMMEMAPGLGTGLLHGARGLPVNASRLNPQAAIPQSILDSRAPLSPAFRAAPGDLRPNFEPQVAAPASNNPLQFTSGTTGNALTVGSDGLPLPGAVGADLTRGNLPALTRGQERRDLHAAVTQTAEDRAGPQMHDPTVYIEGVQRLPAAQRFNAHDALSEQVARETDTAFRDRAEKIDRGNNQVMTDYYRKHAGDDVAIEHAEEARRALAPDNLGVFQGETAVNARPVVDLIDEILKGPAGKQKAVRTYLDEVRGSLHDADGNLETLPSQLYGARRNLTDLLKKAKGPSAEAADIRNAQAQLERVQDVLDPTIGQGSRGFQEYLKGYAEASKPIDQMKYLQGFETGPGKIFGADGYLQFNKVQSMLEKIEKERKAPGVNKAKSLTPDQIEAVINLRNELGATNLRDRISKAAGSPTLMKTSHAAVLGAGPVGTFLRGAGDLAIQGGLLAFPETAGIGNALHAMHVAAIRPAMAASRAQKAANELAALKERLLQTAPAPNGGP